MDHAPILIAARARNGVIGKGNRLPWRIPGELRHFQQRTQGHALICGRTTWASLPKDLTDHGRFMIVMTRSASEAAEDQQPRTYTAATPESAVELAYQICPDRSPLVIGGAQVYATFLPLCAQVEISHIDADPEGDAFMPELKGWTQAHAGAWQGEAPRWQVRTYRRTPQDVIVTEIPGQAWHVPG